MPPVLTKADFVKRYSLGEFGNHSPTWNSIVEWGEDRCLGDDDGLYHVRNRVAGAETWYNVPSCDLLDVWEAACDKYAEANLYISAMCPTHITTLQGYLIDTVGGLHLAYSTVKKPMRDSLLEGQRTAWGPTANLLLRTYMNQRSYDWLQWLLSAYKEHVIEFTCLSRCWGTEPGHNALVWEVRKGY